MGEDKIPVIEEALPELEKHFGKDALDNAVTYILANKHNQITSTYYLLLKQMERKDGTNLVYEYITQSKINASTGNLVGRTTTASSSSYII